MIIGDGGVWVWGWGGSWAVGMNGSDDCRGLKLSQIKVKPVHLIGDDDD